MYKINFFGYILIEFIFFILSKKKSIITMPILFFEAIGAGILTLLMVIFQYFDNIKEVNFERKKSLMTI